MRPLSLDTDPKNASPPLYQVRLPLGTHTHTERFAPQLSGDVTPDCTKPAPSCSPALHEVPANFTQDTNHLHNITHSLAATGQKATKHPNLTTQQDPRDRNSRVAHTNKPQTHRPPQAPTGATMWNYFERCFCHRHENLPPRAHRAQPSLTQQQRFANPSTSQGHSFRWEHAPAASLRR